MKILGDGDVVNRAFIFITLHASPVEIARWDGGEFKAERIGDAFHDFFVSLSISIKKSSLHALIPP